MPWIGFLRKVSQYAIGGILLLSIFGTGLLLTGCRIFKSSEKMTGGVIHSREADRNTVIKSRDIVSFEYEFTTNSVFYRGQNIPFHYCEFSMKKDEDKAVVNIALDDVEPFFSKFSVPLDKLLLLQELVEEENLASSSGVWKEVAGVPEQCGAKLSIKYASGEGIFAYNNTSHVMPNISSGLIYDFFRKLSLEAGGEDFPSGYFRPISDEECEVIVRGKWVGKDNDYILTFQDNELRIYEGEKLIYEGDFSIKIGIFLDKDGRMKFEPFNWILLKRENITAKKLGEKDLVFTPGEGYFFEMVQGFWRDKDFKYKLEFDETNLKVYEGEELILSEEFFIEGRSIYLEGKNDKDIGPFRNLYADIGNIQVLPYVGESEDKRIYFSPVRD